MRRKVVQSLLVSLVLSCGAAHVANADEPQQQTTDGSHAAEASKLTLEVARTLQFHGGEEQQTKLTLVEDALQRFSNPIAGEMYSHLFIWTHKGRPEVAASIHKWYAPMNTLQVELHSLALQPITGEYRHLSFWHPKEAGVAFNPIPDAPVPATSAAGRLRQMRQLTSQSRFRVRIKALNRGGVNEELRLLTRPVHRYKSKDARVLDGAIFCFVRGTDPELLLLIEAREANEAFAWQCAFAPMNSFEFQAFHQDREIWHKSQLAPPWSNIRDPAKTYRVFHIARQLWPQVKTP